LSHRDPGGSVFHPSSLGPSNLTLTLKIQDEGYAHINIIESGKCPKRVHNILSIGKKLQIGKETFEDLDEVKCTLEDLGSGYLFYVLMICSSIFILS
jgi:transcription elongation factor SPT6